MEIFFEPWAALGISSSSTLMKVFLTFKAFFKKEMLRYIMPYGFYYIIQQYIYDYIYMDSI